MNNTQAKNNAQAKNKADRLSLSTTISLQSIQAKAARAALIAQTVRDIRKAKDGMESVDKKDKRSPRTRSESPSKRNPSTPNQLQRELRIIRSAFERAALGRTEFRITKPDAGSSAVCVITTWRKPLSSDSPDGVKGIRLLQDEDIIPSEHGTKEAERTCVFYPSSVDPQRLGSVAIYGTTIVLDYESIRRKGALFGIEIDSVSIEVGRRPFLDVKFGI